MRNLKPYTPKPHPLNAHLLNNFELGTPVFRNFASLELTNMNKADLIVRIAEDAGITKVQANAALDSFIDAVTRTLKADEKVKLVGFGTFDSYKRKARVGRNPGNGDVIKIKSRRVARFKAGKELADKL